MEMEQHEAGLGNTEPARAVRTVSVWTALSATCSCTAFGLVAGCLMTHGLYRVQQTRAAEQTQAENRVRVTSAALAALDAYRWAVTNEWSRTNLKALHEK